LTLRLNTRFAMPSPPSHYSHQYVYTPVRPGLDAWPFS